MASSGEMPTGGAAAATLRLGGRPHYDQLLPQLEEMGWSSADALQALQATGARDLASAIDWLVARGTDAPVFTPVGGTDVVPPRSPVHTEVKPQAEPVVSTHAAAEEDKLDFEKRKRDRELQKAREEKREKEEIQRRIKARLYENKLDRELKYNRGGAAGTISASPSRSITTTTSSSTPVQFGAHAPSARAMLQIRLPTGTTVKREFAATDTIGTVYQFVAQSIGRDTSNFLLLQPGIPKIEYPLETAVTTTLAEAQLVPRGSITVMNREDKGVVRGLEAEPHMDYRRMRLRYPTYDEEEPHNPDAVDTDSMSYEQLLELEERIGSVGKGLSKEHMSGLPTFSYDSSVEISGEPTCAICLSDFDTGNELRKLPCGHAFHKDCIDMWFSDRKTCPTCKLRIDDL